MGKFISNLFLGALAIGLSIFTGSRTLDLLAWALPAGQTIYQWLGLAAFELGMYFWSFYFISGAKGTAQRSISLIMAIFSVVAVCIATVADMTLDAGQAGKIAPLPPTMQQTMIVFVGVTVALNVAAFLACKLMSIEKLREIAEGQAEDSIYGEGLRAIKAISPQIAADAAPYLAAEWSNRTWQKIVPGVQRSTQYLGPVGSPEPPALPAPVSRPAAAPQPDFVATGPVVSSQAPAPVSSPAPAPVAAAPKRGGLRGFMQKLGGTGKQEAVTLAQTGSIPAQPAPASVPAHVASHPSRVRRPIPSVAAARHARRAARFRGAATPGNYQATETAKEERKQAAAPAPAAAPAAAPIEHRTCSECPTVFVVKNAKQLTCSQACRTKRSRRLAGVRKGKKGA